MNSENRVLFKNIISLSSVQIINYILPLASVPIISRIIGPDKYGVINYAGVVISYFALFISYSFNYTATRRLAKDPNNIELRNSIFNEVINARILLFLISTLIFFAGLALNQLSEKLIYIFTYLSCLGMMLNQRWLFQAMQDLSKVVILDLISKLLFTALVIFIIKEKNDYIWQPLILSILTVFVGGISLIWGMKYYKVKFKLLSIRHSISLLMKERVVFSSTIIGTICFSANIVVLGFFTTKEQIGYYASSATLMGILLGVTIAPLMSSFFPFIGNAFNKNHQEGLTIVHKLLPMATFIIGLLCLVAFFLGPIALHLLFGKAFAPAVDSFRIIIFYPLIALYSNMFGSQIMLNLGMDKALFYITLSRIILTLSLNIILSIKLGYIGAAINLVAVELLISILSFVVLKSKGINAIDLSRFNKQEVLTQLNSTFKRKK